MIARDPLRALVDASQSPAPNAPREMTMVERLARALEGIEVELSRAENFEARCAGGIPKSAAPAAGKPTNTMPLVIEEAELLAERFRILNAALERIA